MVKHVILQSWVQILLVEFFFGSCN